MVGIYKITLKDSGECCYVGQSLNIKRRIDEHKRSGLKNRSTPIIDAIRTLGKDAFHFEIIQKCSPEQLDERERFWISELQPKYNVDKGGVMVDEAARKKISASLSRVWDSKTEEEKAEIVKNNLRGPAKGHAVSLETRAKLCMANLGKKQSPESAAKKSESIRKYWANHGRRPGHLKCIAQIGIDGNYVAFHKSTMVAAKSLNVRPTTLSHYISRHQEYRGFLWVPLKRFLNVETNGDECSRVGREDESLLQARGNREAVEDIVRSAAMEKPQAVDKGLIQLALRTCQYKGMNASAINQSAFGGYDDIGDPIILWDKLDSSEEPIGYAFAWKTVTGFTKIIYWTKAKVEAHAKRYSQAYRNGYETPWKTNFDPMALKTVVKDGLSHWGILSVELRRALAEDQSVHRDLDSAPEYPDNMAPTKARLGSATIEAEVTVEPADDPEASPEPPVEESRPAEPPAKPATTRTRATQPKQAPVEQPVAQAAPEPQSDDPDSELVFGLSARLEAIGVTADKFCAWACATYRLSPVQTIQELVEMSVARVAIIIKNWETLAPKIVEEAK